MVKKVLLIMAFAFTFAMASPVGEAQATTNMVTQIQAQKAAQAKVMVQIKAEMAQLQLARPAGWWGWAQCLGAVAVWVGTNVAIGLKVAALVKKAGSIRSAVQKAMVRIKKLPAAKKKLEVAKLFVAVGGEVLGMGAIVQYCFS